MYSYKDGGDYGYGRNDSKKDTVNVSSLNDTAYADNQHNTTTSGGSMMHKSLHGNGKIYNKQSHEFLQKPSTGVNLTSQSFKKKRLGSRRSMQQSSYSHSKFNTNMSVHNIKGTDTYLSRFGTKNNFHMNHNRILDTIKSNLAKSVNFRNDYIEATVNKIY